MSFSNRALMASIVLLAAGILLWRFGLRAVHAQTKPTGDAATEAWRSRWLAIEDKAKAAEAGDPDSVRALADAIFDQPHILGTLPPLIRIPVEDRVIHAEMDYRSGEGPPVTDNEVAKLINWLSDKFALPDYTRTREHQILVMRFHTLANAPRFMGKGLLKGEDGTPLSVGDSVNSTMSPLQACYLAMFAIDSKLVNPDYQMAPDAWETHRYQESLQKWQSYQRTYLLKQEGTLVQKQPGPGYKLVALTGSKQMELRRIIQARAGTMNAGDWVNLAQSALDTLGIERLP